MKEMQNKIKKLEIEVKRKEKIVIKNPTWFNLILELIKLIVGIGLIILLVFLIRLI